MPWISGPPASDSWRLLRRATYPPLATASSTPRAIKHSPSGDFWARKGGYDWKRFGSANQRNSTAR
jgi:hypothetical protein